MAKLCSPFKKISPMTSFNLSRQPADAHCGCQNDAQEIRFDQKDLWPSKCKRHNEAKTWIHEQRNGDHDSPRELRNKTVDRSIQDTFRTGHWQWRIRDSDPQSRDSRRSVFAGNHGSV